MTSDCCTYHSHGGDMRKSCGGDVPRYFLVHASFVFEAATIEEAEDQLIAMLADDQSCTIEKIEELPDEET